MSKFVYVGKVTVVCMGLKDVVKVMTSNYKTTAGLKPGWGLNQKNQRSAGCLCWVYGCVVWCVRSLCVVWSGPAVSWVCDCCLSGLCGGRVSWVIVCGYGVEVDVCLILLI